jgi:hypothetical protein
VDVLKKTITYEDFNGEKITEDFFFHLSKAELVELEMSHKGGLSEALQRIIASEDNKEIIAEFKKIILASYGQRSYEGKHFVKNDQLREEFMSTEAYSVLFMELLENADAATEFVNGIMPAGLVEEAAKVVNEKSPLQPVRQVNRKDTIEMSAEDLEQLGKDVQEGKAVLID